METLDTVKKAIKDDIKAAQDRIESGAKKWWQLNRRQLAFVFAGIVVGAVVALVLFG